MSQAKISRLVEAYNRVNLQYKELEAERKALSEQIKSVAVDGVAESASHKILVSERGRSTLDRKALEATYGKDTIAEYAKHTSYTVLTVKEKVGSPRS